VKIEIASIGTVDGSKRSSLAGVSHFASRNALEMLGRITRRDSFALAREFVI
jgi:hypothetical protein